MGVRNRAGVDREFELYSAVGPLGVRFERRISAAAASAMEREGTVKQFFYEPAGRFIYQRVAADEKPVKELDSSKSSSVLTLREAEAAIGFEGDSKTAGLNETQRRIIEALNGEAYDYVERCQFKLNAFKPAFT